MRSRRAMQMRRGRRARSLGEVDMTDFAVGMFLVFFLPVVCYFLSGIVMTGGAQSSIKEREKPEVDPDPDGDEILAQFKAGEELLRKNARGILAQAESIPDANLKEQYRIWAKRSIETADKYLAKLADNLKRYPELGSRASSYLESIAALRKEAQRDFDRVRKLDILNRDGPQ